MTDDHYFPKEPKRLERKSIPEKERGALREPEEEELSLDKGGGIVGELIMPCQEKGAIKRRALLRRSTERLP